MILRLLALFVLAGGGRTLAGTRPPNVVIILADDLGYGDVGANNPAAKIPTPHLDRLAREGFRSTDAHSPSAVCTPTRYALLTGRYAWRTRLQRHVLPPWGAPLIAADRLTLPALLRARGYATAAIGKWHLGWEWPTTDGKPPESARNRLSNVDFTRAVGGGPTTRGFDYFFGVDLPNMPPYCFIENDRTVGLPSVPDTGAAGGFNRPGPMVPGWELVNILPELTTRAERWIAAHAAPEKKPFFLYVPLTSPHFPVVPSAEFQGRSRVGDYGDFVMETDATVGRILAALARAGVGENTLVIFTSDNGPEVHHEVKPGAYERIRLHGHASMGELRGAKRDLWEGGHRVPFLARWPGRIAAGTVSAEPINLVDLMATVAALVGAPLPPHAAEDSFDLSPLLLGRDHAQPLRPPQILHGGTGRFGLRDGPWMLIDAPTGDDNTGDDAEPAWFKTARGYEPHAQPGELYDLAADPAQRRNLYAAQPARVQAMKALLEKYRRDGRTTPGPVQPNDPVPARATAPPAKN
jgi:arylsulfatase A-like enzyme